MPIRRSSTLRAFSCTAAAAAAMSMSITSLNAFAQGAAPAQGLIPVHTSFAVPKVIGPVPVTTSPGAGVTRDYPFFATEPNFDLGAAGYVEEEFFVQGFATRYETPPMADAVPVSAGHPYKTRIVVRRPVDPQKFNGVVLVEWANVTARYGIDVHWLHSREYLTRAGYVVVRVDAQRVGIHEPNTGLKDFSPTRYSSLDVTAGGTITDDSLSYDIFSQVVRALKARGKEQMLGPLAPKAVMALGQSQSAIRLTSYYNSVQPLHKVVDGFLVMVHGGPFRTDVKAPLMRVISETELMLYNLGPTRQPDSPTLREWEIAGAAHVEYKWVLNRTELALRDKVPAPNLACDPQPASHVPLRYVLNAGYHHLSNWVLKGVQPPRAEPIQMSSFTPAVIVRDANGIALGGIRQAEVEAPTATNRGDQVNMTPGCPNNYGMHIPFSDEKLSQLYPTKDAYVRAVTEAVKKNVQDGFVLKEDGDEIIRRAQSSNAGTGRPLIIR